MLGAVKLVMSRLNAYTSWAFNPQHEQTSRCHPGVEARGARHPARSRSDCSLAEQARRTSHASRWESSSAPVFVSPNLGAVLNILDDERRTITEFGDPVLVLSAIEELRTALEVVIGELDSESPRPVRDLRRRGWTFERISAASGVPSARVAELARATLSAARST